MHPGCVANLDKRVVISGLSQGLEPRKLLFLRFVNKLTMTLQIPSFSPADDMKVPVYSVQKSADSYIATVVNWGKHGV